MCIRFMAGKYNILWPISILRIALPIICKTFCVQIFVLLLSTFKCIHSDLLYYAAVVECDTGTWYYFILILGCISLIIQIILSYVTASLYYHCDFVYEAGDVLKKNNSEIGAMFEKDNIIERNLHSIYQKMALDNVFLI